MSLVAHLRTADDEKVSLSLRILAEEDPLEESFQIDHDFNLHRPGSTMPAQRWRLDAVAVVA